MKPEDQITALAKWDGWVEVRAEVDWMPLELTGIYTFPHPKDPEKIRYYVSRKPIPNYLSDLNAIRLLLLKLNTKQQEVFTNYVEDLAENPEAALGYDETHYYGYIETPPTFVFKMLTLSPELLCKALLKTLKLWA